MSNFFESHTIPRHFTGRRRRGVPEGAPEELWGLKTSTGYHEQLFLHQISFFATFDRRTKTKTTNRPSRPREKQPGKTRMRKTGRNLQPDIKPPGQFPNLSTLARDPKAKSSEDWEKARGPSIALLPSCLHWPVLFFASWPTQDSSTPKAQRDTCIVVPGVSNGCLQQIFLYIYIFIYVYTILYLSLSIIDCMRLPLY